jgi:hypothetical protein
MIEDACRTEIPLLSRQDTAGKGQDRRTSARALLPIGFEPRCTVLRLQQSPCRLTALAHDSGIVAMPAQTLAARSRDVQELLALALLVALLASVAPVSDRAWVSSAVFRKLSTTKKRPDERPGRCPAASGEKPLEAATEGDWGEGIP